MLKILLILGIGVAMFFLFRWTRGHLRKSFLLDLDDRYIEWSDHVAAAKAELQKQDKEVSYLGNGEFIIDGKYYMMINWNFNMAHVPLQRTLLKYDKEKNKQAKKAGEI